MPQSVIHEESNRTTVPEEVVETGILALDDELHWAYGSDEDAAYVSGAAGPLDDADRLEPIGVQGMDGQEARVPEQLFGKDRTDAPNPLGLFDYGETVEWTVLRDAEMCRVEPA